MAGPLHNNRINKIPDFVTINRFLYLLQRFIIGRFMGNHIRWHNGYVNRQDRNRLNNHRTQELDPESSVKEALNLLKEKHFISLNKS